MHNRRTVRAVVGKIAKEETNPNPNPTVAVSSEGPTPRVGHGSSPDVHNLYYFNK